MDRPESVIQSVANSRVKGWAELLTKKGRDKQGRFLVEGVHLVQEALASGAAVKELIYSEQRGLPPEIAAADLSGIERIRVSEAVLAKCTDTEHPQSVLAVANKPRQDANEVLSRDRCLAVVCDGIQDPGNLGTIIRSADAAGADAVILGKGTVDSTNPKVVRSTMGSLFHVAVLECDLPEMLREARSRGIQICGTFPANAMSCYDADLTGSTWIMIGNEAGGISEAAAEWIDHRLTIPMPGRAESLNAAMAATILLFEAVRQRIK